MIKLSDKFYIFDNKKADSKGIPMTGIDIKIC